MDDIETTEDDQADLIALAADTLRGDIRDSLLAWSKATPKPWHEMTEAEQRDRAASADAFSGALIKQACGIIAAAERPCIVATLAEYREKDGIEAKLKLAGTRDVVASLHDACGREVLIVTSGAEDFMGQGGDAEIDADQPEIPGVGQEYRDAA